MNKDAFLAMSKRLQELEALNEEQARVIRDMNHELDACQEDAEKWRNMVRVSGVPYEVEASSVKGYKPENSSG